MLILTVTHCFIMVANKSLYIYIYIIAQPFNERINNYSFVSGDDPSRERCRSLVDRGEKETHSETRCIERYKVIKLIFAIKIL